MSLARYAASVPAGALLVPALEISHPSWSAPERRALQPGDWTLTVDGEPTLFPGWSNAGPWLSEHPTVDDTGRASRTVTLDDPANALFAQIEAVRDSDDAVALILRWYFSTDPTALLLEERYDIESAAPGDGQLELVAMTLDIANQADPYIRHTLANSPGLRGR